MDTYTPVQYVYKEVIEEQIQKEGQGKVFFFNDAGEVDSHEGRLLSLIEIPQQGLFIALDPETRIRVDRIITLFGKPGAAYDEYDAYANACLSCTGGYDL
jgi:hypothetical protein